MPDADTILDHDACQAPMSWVHGDTSGAPRQQPGFLPSLHSTLGRETISWLSGTSGPALFRFLAGIRGQMRTAVEWVDVAYE